MDILRVIDAYCPRCQRVRRHDVLSIDPGRCICNVCNNQQPLMVPIGSSGATRVAGETVEADVDQEAAPLFSGN